MIDHADLHPVGETACREPNPATCWLISQRIRQQVDDHPLQQGRIGDHLGHVGSQIDLDIRRPQRQLVQGRHDDLGRIDRHHRDPEHPGLQPGDVEQVGDEVGQFPQGVIGGLQQVVTILVGQPGPLAAQT